MAKQDFWNYITTNQRQYQYGFNFILSFNF